LEDSGGSRFYLTNKTFRLLTELEPRLTQQQSPLHLRYIGKVRRARQCRRTFVFVVFEGILLHKLLAYTAALVVRCVLSSAMYHQIALIRARNVRGFLLHEILTVWLILTVLIFFCWISFDRIASYSFFFHCLSL
jgi:hypothetical protein